MTKVSDSFLGDLSGLIEAAGRPVVQQTTGKPAVLAKGVVLSAAAVAITPTVTSAGFGFTAASQVTFLVTNLNKVTLRQNQLEARLQAANIIL